MFGIVYHVLILCCSSWILQTSTEEENYVVERTCGLKLLLNYPEFERLFKQAGWFEYVHRLTNGYHSGVALSFAQSFNGTIVIVGDLNFEVTEQSIADACGLPMDGEH